MEFFRKLFGYKKKQSNSAKMNHMDSNKSVPKNENVIKLQELKVFIDSLMNFDRYIAKSDYLQKMKEYEAVINFFHVLETSGMLDNFSRINKIALSV